MIKTCFIGLGNPGEKYNSTRHNIGRDWIKQISNDLNIELKERKKIDSFIGYSESGDFAIAFPNNYVNNSGESVLKILKYENLDISKLIIIYDDIDLPLGSIKIKLDGGHGGHNGIKDIINFIGKKDFIRIRVGIGHPGSKELVTNWVLSKFKPNEKKLIKNSFIKFNNIFLLLVKQKISEAQRYIHK